MALNSPYPPAAVARVPAPDGGGAVSGLLVPRHMGYLHVRVLFHGQPQVGLEVAFFERGDDGAKGAAIGEKTTTGDDGVASVPRLVPAGLYVCEIEDQPPAEVPTVVSVDRAAPVVLPVGRPSVDAFEANEFEVRGEGKGDEDEGDEDEAQGGGG